MTNQQEEISRIKQELLNQEIEITDKFYVPRLKTEVAIPIHLVIKEPEKFMTLLKLEDYSDYTGEQFIEMVITCNVLIGIPSYSRYGAYPIQSKQIKLGE